MSVAQRRVLAVVGAVVVISALVVVLTRSGGGGDEQRLAVEGATVDASTSTSTSTTAPAAATTLPLVPITTGVPVPDATEAPPATAPPSATPAAPRSTSTSGSGAAAAAPGATPVDGTGALLVRPANAPLRPVDKAKGCNSANDAGWKIEDCGALKTNNTVLLWVVETKGSATRALVLKEQTAGQWALLLRAGAGNGTWSRVGVRGEDVSGDGQPELVFGFHGSADDKPLAVDLVDANATVVVHRDLSHGIAQTAKGSLTTWSAAGDGYDQQAITFAGGGWQASAPQRVARTAAPQASSV